MEDISEVITAIANYYKDSISSPERIQLWKKTATENTLIEDLDDIPDEYYLKPKSGGLSLTIVLLPSPNPSRQASEISLVARMGHLITAEDIEGQARKRQRIEISDLTTQLQSFANAQLVDECLQSPNDVFLPYPQKKIKKIYVRKCYEDVFDLLLKNINMESFAISGTPGIGKSLFFVYILYRLMKDFSEKTLSLKPNRIVYQMTNSYRCFDLQQQTVAIITKLEAEVLVLNADTFYVIDGQTTQMSSSCITLFISSPRSQQYKKFVDQTMAKEWYFPVWTLAELQTCQRHCYPDLSIEILEERYRVCGGVARFVFHQDYSIPVPKKMKSALNDADAIRGVKYVGETTNIFPESHSLLQILVGDDEFGNAYQFVGLDVASKYVGEQLWIHHSAQMMTNLQDMFGGSPNEISRHLFEIYGHMVFSVGGRALKCRCLEDATVTEITLDALNSQRITFGKDTIPTAAALTGSYYEPTDDDNFPAIDSLSPQGMFQFTVAAEHPIRGVKTLRSLCKLYDEPKLYFVVPPHRFEKFKKQSFKAKQGTIEVGPVAGLKQYVLELPVKQ
jgi:hypothetical protein